MTTKYRIMLSKRIASCFASFSSTDVILYKEVASLPRVFNKEGLVVDDVALVKVLHLESDETFYERALEDMRHKRVPGHYNTHPDFLALVQKHKDDGWDKKPEWLDAADKARYAREEAAEYARRKQEGYVICKHFKEMTPDDYRGGFSDEVMASKELKEYVAAGACFGYIGSSCRKPNLDAYIEEQFLSLKPRFEVSRQEMVALLGGWLTSSDGRHFGDALDGCYGLAEQQDLVDRNIKAMFNIAFIYAHPEQDGTMKSTEVVRGKVKAKLFECEGRY